MLPTHLQKKIEVRKSGIEGRGVFAKKDFKQGEYILTAKGPIVRWVVKNKQSSLVGPNWLGISKYRWVDVAPPVRYLNHSCDPNMGIRGRVRFYALRPIKAGEELTFDYSTTEGDELWGMTCHCGSTKCRKKLGSIQSIPRRTFKKYLPYIPTYFAKVYQNALESYYA